MAATPQDQLALLRDEIRRAGKKTGRTRRALSIGLLAATVAIFAYAWVTQLPRYPDDSLGSLGQLICIVGLVFGIGCSLVIALPSAVLYRLRQLGRMRGVLAQLPPAQRMAILLPLQHEPSADVRKIVGPLLHEFGPRTEVAPAAAPEGRGSEAAGA